MTYLDVEFERVRRKEVCEREREMCCMSRSESNKREQSRSSSFKTAHKKISRKMSLKRRSHSKKHKTKYNRTRKTLRTKREQEKGKPSVVLFWILLLLNFFGLLLFCIRPRFEN